MLKSKKGFSLIELMIVGIISLLASLAIPNYQLFQEKSHQAEAKINLSSIFTLEQSFAAEFGGYSSEFDQIGYSPTGPLMYNYGPTVFVPSSAPNAPDPRNNAGPPAAWQVCNYTYCNAGIAAPQVGGACATELNVIWTCNMPNGQPNMPIGDITVATFKMIAGGNLNGNGVTDVWSIDNKRNFVNIQNGL